jgi:hypothetical protein
MFRTFASTPGGSFREVDRLTFPPSLAIQNALLDSLIGGQVRDPAHLEVSDKLLRSLTAHFWEFLATGRPTNMFEPARREIVERFCVSHMRIAK